MPLTAAPRSNLLHFVEDLLSYMTTAEKRGQLETAMLPLRESENALDPQTLRKLRAGQVGTVIGPRSPAEATELQRLAVEETRLGIPLLFADRIDEAAWPSPIAMTASWDVEAVENLARHKAMEANTRGVTWVAAPSFCSPAPTSRYRSSSEFTFLARYLRDAVVRGLSGSENGQDLARFGHALVLLRDGDFGSSSSTRPDGEPADAPGEAFIGRDFSSWHADVGADGPKLDQAVRRILMAKAQLGLFRDPFKRVEGSRLAVSGDYAAARAALARKSMILLRNEDSVLPLQVQSEPVLCVDCGSGMGEAVGERLAARGIAYRKLTGLALRQEALDQPNALFAADGMAIGIAANAASRARAVMLFVGEADCEPGPGLPRLGPAAKALLAGLVHANPHCVLVSATALPLDPTCLPKDLAAHLHAWSPETGFEEPIAAILTGESPPQGKLPMALGEPEQPQFHPFGHGLTYGTLQSSHLTIEFGCDSVIAQVKLTNPHPLPVCETVQLYVRTPHTPDLRLRGFQRLEVPAGGSQEARFQLSAAHLGEANDSAPWRVQSGRFAISIGCDSVSGQSGEVDIPADLARAISVPAALRGLDYIGARNSG